MNITVPIKVNAILPLYRDKLTKLNPLTPGVH